MKDNIRLIQSIQRALDIISCFSQDNYLLSLGEIAQKLELNINTTRGIVNTLLYNGYLIHDEHENKYSLGLVFIPKADLVNSKFVDRFKSIIKPYLKEIANKYQASSRLQLVSNNSIFTVETINPIDSRYILLTRLDTIFPLNATSSGKLFLYYMDDKSKNAYLDNLSQHKFTNKTITEKDSLLEELEFIHNNGYSCEYEEVGIGISSIAIPILNKKQKLIATISLTGSSTIIEGIADNAVMDIKQFIESIDTIHSS
ncbi:MAG: IclR family transcriptional regulator [Acholeplasma sp.]|nr:IclR family transcriptional regulator [Acholeplasma sp.]